MFPGTMPCSLVPSEYWPLSVVVITMTYKSSEPPARRLAGFPGSGPFRAVPMAVVGP